MKLDTKQLSFSQWQNLSEKEAGYSLIAQFIGSEEVWSIGGDEGWIIDDVCNQQIIYIWPTQKLAENFSQQFFTTAKPLCVSLEHFLFKTIVQCLTADINVAMFPESAYRAGIIPARQLSGMLEAMMETGSYFIES